MVITDQNPQAAASFDERVEMKPFVTISASYGAGGSQIGPAVAARLGVPFFDRAIPAQVAERLGTSTDDPRLSEQRPCGFWERLLMNLAPMSSLYGASDLLIGAAPPILTELDYRTEIDRVIRGAADGAAGGVLLGRAGAIVLAGHRRALHVRLDGPLARRVRAICRELGVDESEAATQLHDNDGAREAYVKQLYDTNAKDPDLYHVIIDSTTIAPRTCVEMIVLAAEARPGAGTDARPLGVGTVAATSSGVSALRSH